MQPNAELPDAMAMAEQLAGERRFDSRAILCRAVNEALGIDWTDAAWRGLFNRNPDFRQRVERAMGQTNVIQRSDGHTEIRIDGDIRGSVSGDEHVPFHDPKAIAVMCDVLKWWKPDLHIHNGDQSDHHQISQFDKNPARMYTIQDEADQTKDELYAPVRRAIPKARVIKINGNHCIRLMKYLHQHPELMGLRALRLENLYELDKFRIDYASLRVRFGSLLEVSHGTRVAKWAGASAKAELEQRRFGISTITNHVHRAGRCETKTVNGGYVVGHENACLCTLQPDYMIDPDWVHGFSLFEIRGNRLWIETVIINQDYTVCAAGKWFGGL